MMRSARLRRYTPLRPVAITARRGKIEAPEYLDYLRTLSCEVANGECWGPTDPHHIGKYGQARRNDWNAVNLCRFHHDLYHKIKQATFEARYSVSIPELIARRNREFKQRESEASMAAGAAPTETSTIRFSPNVPYEVILRFPDGMRVNGRWGSQIMFTLEQPFNGRMYLPEFAANQIKALNLAHGEPVTICKVITGQKITWRVERAPNPPSAHGELTVPRIEAKSEERPAAQPALAVVNGPSSMDPKTELSRCYSDAIEVLVTARDQAVKVGLPVQFTGEDLRQVAAVLYIDAGKNRRCPGAH